MTIIVQKFGGTSVATEDSRKRVIDKIVERKEEGYDIVVVVSAIGRSGDPYATDTLKSIVDEDAISKAELDLLISCGEVISSIVLSNELKLKGLETVVLTGANIGIITDNNYGSSNIIDFDKTNIESGLNKGKVVVVAGFQGSTLDGNITTLGRGGSDISASVIGGYLAADFVEIYTDVDGVMTADPRIVKDARVIDTMCYSEVSQLAEDGAKVIHPKAIDIAQRFDVPILIRNTYSDSQGTYIEEINMDYLSNRLKLSSDKIMSAITYKKGRVQVNLKLEDSKVMNKLMKDFVRNDISLDLINFFKESKVFTIDEDKLSITKGILDRYQLKYEILEKCCKISCIGYKMRGVPGVMADIFEALMVQDIDILQSSDSHNTIWCLIEEKNLNKALQSLHTRFRLHE